MLSFGSFGEDAFFVRTVSSGLVSAVLDRLEADELLRQRDSRSSSDEIELVDAWASDP